MGSNYLRKIPRQYFEAYNNFFLNDSLLTEGLSTRIDGQIDEQPLCLSKEELLFPKKAQTIDKETKLIVNHGNYLQGVRVEVCMNESSPCQFKESFPAGYTTVCRQKYIARKLVVVTTADGSDSQTPLSTSDFLFPSCCVCKTRNIGR
ncbi:hypothetical protein GE061_016896 [Apolygus lucorum]|uniref:Spaetzle domain-containing protein n=1 Tax=Apolygus lucorum TaxID=248454 RepID=A0A8S9XHA7_APOLU|nr:hypothetical protein GE061_016896 [Apolygus lucorum]